MEAIGTENEIIYVWNGRRHVFSREHGRADSNEPPTFVGRYAKQRAIDKVTGGIDRSCRKKNKRIINRNK